MCAAGPAGPVALSWQEIAAFSAMKAVSLPPDCWQILRDMSAAYVAALHDKNPLSIAPMERLDDD